VIARRHAQYFRDLFEPASDDWQRLPDSDWCAKYQPELDNVRATLDWAFGSGGDPAIGIELSAATGKLWQMLFLRNEGQQRLEAAVSKVGSQTSESDQARLWRWLGDMWAMKLPAQAVAAYERAVGLQRRVGDGSVLGVLLVDLGEELARMGRIERARTLSQKRFLPWNALGRQRRWPSIFSFPAQ
jgi:hypothetical protein